MTSNSESATSHRAFDAEKQHWINVRVYYEDTDFTGMVYHANYLRFFERGRSDFLRDAGVSHQDLLDRPDPAAFTLVRFAWSHRLGAVAPFNDRSAKSSIQSVVVVRVEPSLST